MKAKLFQLNSLLPKINDPYCVAIFYGTDDGEINKGFQQVKSFLHVKSGDFNVIEISADMLKTNPFVATDEANSMSLMGGQRVLLIQEESSFSHESLTHFLEYKKTDAILLIKAGNLTKTSSLRKEAEQNPYVLAFACYPPSEMELQKDISSFLSQAGKTISPDALKYLTQKLTSNAGVIQQELNKLLIFLGNEKQITTASIDEIITNSSDVMLDQFCIDIASGQLKKVDKGLQIIASTKDFIPSTIYTLLGYFSILIKLIESGQYIENKEKILAKELKPNQFKLKDPLLSQSQQWPRAAAIQVLQELERLEELTRQTGIPEYPVFARTCIKIASFAQKLN